MRIKNFKRLETDYCVSLEEAKNHLRVYETDDDAEIQTLIEVACQKAEMDTNLRLQRCTYTMSGAVTKGQTVFMPYGLTSITAIKASGSALQVDVDYEYHEIHNDVIRFLKSFNSVDIEVEAGFPYDHVHKGIQQAIKIMIGTLYECRMDVTFGIQAYQMPFTYRHLISDFINWTKDY